MNMNNEMSDESGGGDLARILARWEIADPGESFFTLLPARIQERAAARRHSAFAAAGLRMPAFTAAAAAVVIAFGLLNVRSQTAATEKLVTEAAAWSVEDRAAITDIPAGEVVDAQAAGLDESLATAVERMSIENKNGYQLLDDLGADELNQLVLQLNKGKG